MNIIILILAAIKSVGDCLGKIFDRQAKKQKEKEDAAKKTSSKTFYMLIVLCITLSGCGYVYVVSTPMTFDPNDYQPLKAGQVFTVPQDGIYFSDYAKEKWIKAKIAEYELRKRGFDKDDK
jgi:hypothetical protein